MSNQMNSLTTLIKRLEAATSRLEDMVPNTTDASAPTNGIQAGQFQSPTNNRAIEQAGVIAPTPQQYREALPPAIDDFDAMINAEVKTFVNMSEEIGGLVAEQAAAVLRSFAAERKFLIITTKAKKPDIQSPIYMEILKELQSMMGSVNDIREANRASPLFTHLTTVSEGIAVLGWITVEPKPAEFVGEVLSGAQFYGNRIITVNKEKDRKQVEWVNAFYSVFKALSKYVKQHYPSGVTWNNQQGIAPEQALQEIRAVKSPPPTSSGAPPPPPPAPMPSLDGPPPPPPMPANGSSSNSGGAADMGAVFDQISRGSDVTSGLRKVDPSAMTHKNPSLRSSAAVPSGPSRSSSQTSTRSIPSKKPKPESMRTKKPPRKELEGNKWLIENYDNPNQMLEIDAAITHSILITRCTKTAIRVIGKANAISLDNCSSCSLIIDSLVSAVDVIKSPKFEMQVLGSLPTILLDQVDSAAIYLGKESLGTEVFTSLCTGVNVNLPGAREEDDYVERPLPEQIKTYIKDGRVISEIVEHAG